MATCTLKVVDPEIVTCKYCFQKLHILEMPDHAVAHILHQKTVEKQIV